VATGKVWRCENHDWCGIGDCPMCKEDKTRNAVFDAAMELVREYTASYDGQVAMIFLDKLIGVCRKAEEVER